MLTPGSDLMLQSIIGQPKAIPLTELKKYNQNIISYLTHPTEVPRQPFKTGFLNQLDES